MLVVKRKYDLPAEPAYARIHRTGPPATRHRLSQREVAAIERLCVTAHLSGLLVNTDREQARAGLKIAGTGSAMALAHFHFDIASLSLWQELEASSRRLRQLVAGDDRQQPIAFVGSCEDCARAPQQQRGRDGQGRLSKIATCHTVQDRTGE